MGSPFLGSRVDPSHPDVIRFRICCGELSQFVDPIRVNDASNFTRPIRFGRQWRLGFDLFARCRVFRRCVCVGDRVYGLQPDLLRSQRVLRLCRDLCEAGKVLGKIEGTVIQGSVPVQ